MKNLVMRSYAKINICLDVVGKKENGYHELDMVMLPLQIHDTLLISELRKGTDNFVTIDDFSNGPIHYNVATAAIEKFAKTFGFPNKFRISIHKVLPMQAGLGGGSSNAGAAVLGVNKMLKLNATEEQMIDVVRDLGADIPFFIKNVPARCRGIGDAMEPIHVQNNYWVLLVKPTEGCGTQAIYEISDIMELKTGDVDAVVRALAEGDDEALAKSIFNNLEEPAIYKVPKIKEIKEELKQIGLDIVLMSGSGSTVFALSTNKKQICEAAKIMETKHQDYFVEVTKVLK